MRKNSAYTFVSLCVFILSNISFSQHTKIDSLKGQLKNHAKKDTTRVNLLNALAFSYFSKDLSKTLEYLEEANAITEVVPFKRGQARSIYIKGITEAVQSNHEQALLFYNKALKLYENIDFQKGVANCYNAMGIIYKNKGELRKSIDYFKKAIRIEEETGSKNLTASLINLGSSYTDIGEFSEAISPLKKALSIAKTNKNTQRIAYSLNNLGIVYKAQGNYPLALKHYKESLYINKKLGDSLGIANNLHNMGMVYKTQKFYDKAIKYYEKSLEIHERTNRKQGISSLLNNIGTIYEEKKDYKNALNHYVKALRMSKQIGAKSSVPFILNNIGETYLALNDYRTANQYFTESKKNSLEIESRPTLCKAYIGLAKIYVNQKEYNNALGNILKAKEISEKSGFLDYQKDVSEILFKIYKAMGKYKIALKNHQRFKILSDSLFNKKNIEKITQLEYEYRYKQVLDSAKIKELQLTKTVRTTSQNLEKSQRNLLLGVITFLTIALLMGAVIFAQKLRNVQTKTQNIIVGQKLLRSQMTPHFIFNSLSVLQGMILNKEEKTSVLYLSKFSKLLRTILENSRHKMVALSEELSAINSYMALQNLDVNPPFNYTLIVGPKIDRYTLKIPPMLIQPFIENAIEHAFPSKKENKEIIVALTFEDKKLICTITDNGIGINEEKQNARKNKNSLATTITSERLDMLSKEFNTEGSISVKNRKEFGQKGTLVTLVIPYVKQDIQ